MRSLLAEWSSRRIFRVGPVLAVALGAAACSSDTTRLSDNSYGGPYAAQPPANQMAAAPYQLPPPAPPPPAPPPPLERRSLPETYGHAPDTTGTVRSGGHWEWAGGTAVIVGPGETVEGIARQHHVPARAIVDANGITNPAAILPGQRLVIPRYVPDGIGAKLANAAAPRAVATPAASAAPAAPAGSVARAAPAAPAGPVSRAAPALDPSLPSSAPAGAGQTLLPVPPVHTVAAGDTLSRIAHKYRVKVQDVALANGLQPETPLKIGMKITVPIKPAAMLPKSAAAPAKGQQAATPAAGSKPAGPGTAQAKAPAASGKVAGNDSKAQMVQPAEPQIEEAVNGVPAFRWPLRGRVIANFGAKLNGSANDGIDLAAPEGTPVRAADDGVVAYSGNELKGYGNLVLVRHANGFVTAYAHASELLVKRNDQVHKGQVIAKSGQTGTATSPQLHFEIRKNSAPVDPVQYLPADKTASAPL